MTHRPLRFFASFVSGCVEVVVIIVLIGGHGTDHAIVLMFPSYFCAVQLEATERHIFGVVHQICVLSNSGEA